MHISRSMSIWIHTHTYTHIYIHIYTYTYICIIYIYWYIYTLTHTYIHTRGDGVGQNGDATHHLLGVAAFVREVCGIAYNHFALRVCLLAVFSDWYYPACLVCVCVCERERERARETDHAWFVWEWGCVREREWPHTPGVCVWVCACVREMLSYTQMSHVTHMKKSCHTCERDMSHTQMGHVIGIKAYMTHKWVMSHISTSHVTHVNETRHTHRWASLAIGHSMSISVSPQIQMCDVTIDIEWASIAICHSMSQ